MKGLIRTSIIIAALIVVSIGIGAILTSDIRHRLAAAHERGYEDGHAQGYQVGFQKGSNAGYQEGGKIGYLRGDGGDYDSSNEAGFYLTYNPTYNEVRAILVEAKAGSAKEVHDYAEANGIRSAYVRVPIARKAREGMVYVYQLVAFETIGNGLLIIEPRSHREVKVEVGKRYSELNGLPTRPYDDTITEVTIVW